MVHWFQGSFPDGCLGDEVLTGDLSLGLICVLDSADGQGCRGCLQVLILHLFGGILNFIFSDTFLLGEYKFRYKKCVPLN